MNFINLFAGCGGLSLGHLTGIRDVYAHQTEKQIGDGHNEEKCKYIREEIRSHLENVTKVTSSK